MMKSSNCHSSETIGFSEEGRPLEIIFAGQAEAQLRVFILAGQHGDEACSREAARAFAPLFRAQYEPYFASMRLAILADANPDGAAKNTRLNARGLDLNRDHLRLESRETAAIHHFVRAWQPHLIIDAHVYPSRRGHLLAQNLLYSQDLFVDVPTHPAVGAVMNQTAVENFFATMNEMLAQRGLSCERYTLVRPSGKVRHSTLHVCDARQTLALRHEVCTICWMAVARNDGRASKAWAKRFIGARRPLRHFALGRKSSRAFNGAFGGCPTLRRMCRSMLGINRPEPHPMHLKCRDQREHGGRTTEVQITRSC
jgi:hypothetical protein